MLLVFSTFCLNVMTKISNSHATECNIENKLLRQSNKIETEIYLSVYTYYTQKRDYVFFVARSCFCAPNTVRRIRGATV